MAQKVLAVLQQYTSLQCSVDCLLKKIQRQLKACIVMCGKCQLPHGVAAVAWFQ